MHTRSCGGGGGRIIGAGGGAARRLRRHSRDTIKPGVTASLAIGRENQETEEDRRVRRGGVEPKPPHTRDGRRARPDRQIRRASPPDGARPDRQQPAAGPCPHLVVAGPPLVHRVDVSGVHRDRLSAGPRAGRLDDAHLATHTSRPRAGRRKGILSGRGAERRERAAARPRARAAAASSPQR